VSPCTLECDVPYDCRRPSCARLRSQGPQCGQRECPCIHHPSRFVACESGFAVVPITRLHVRNTLLALIIATSSAAGADAAAPKCNSRHFVGVFSDCDLAQLRSWHVTPVAPSYVPPGYVGKLRLDWAEKKYDITYAGPHGAYFIFEGGEHVSLGQPEEKNKHNILSGLKNLFGHHKTASPSSRSGLAPEEEADPNQLDVAAPSLVIGPAHFKPDAAGCATGVSERGLNNTKYALKGCNPSQDVLKDELVRVYRSATQVKAP